jgi:hypothetical protein
MRPTKVKTFDIDMLRDFFDLVRLELRATSGPTRLTTEDNEERQRLRAKYGYDGTILPIQTLDWDADLCSPEADAAQERLNQHVFNELAVQLAHLDAAGFLLRQIFINVDVQQNGEIPIIITSPMSTT